MEANTYSQDSVQNSDKPRALWNSTGDHNIQSFKLKSAKTRSSTGNIQLIFDMLILTKEQLIDFLTSQLSSGFSQSHADSLRASVGGTLSFLKQPVK